MDGALSRREREVAELVAEGLTNREIADRLVIAERTAEGHVEQIRNKLGFHSRSQIAAWVVAQRPRALGQPISSPGTAAAAAPAYEPIVPVTVRFPRLPRRAIAVALSALLVGIAAFTFWPRPAAFSLVVVAGIGTDGFSGDGGPAVAAQFSEITSMGFGPGGELYVADANNPAAGLGRPSGSYIVKRTRVRRIDSSGTVQSIAGDAQPSRSFNTSDNGRNLFIFFPGRIAVAPTGEIYVAAGDRDMNFVGRIEQTTRWTWLAGGFPADPAYPPPYVLRSMLSSPTGLAVGSEGTVYVANAGTSTIMAIPPAGEVVTIAGTGERGAAGDGGPARAASLYAPLALALSRDGSLHIADTYNHRIRAIDHGGIITTIVGDGTEGFAGDSGPAARARLSLPSDLAFGPNGVLYIADTGNARIRAVAKDGAITTVAGPQGLERPTALAVDREGTLYIADSGTHQIYRLSR